MKQIGRQALYSNKVPSSIPKKEGERGQRYTYKNRTLDKIACRYYYHAVLRRLRYDDCIISLCDEFDLVSTTIIGKLNKRNAYLDDLITAETTAAALKKKYPWYDWSGQPMVKLNPRH